MAQWTENFRKKDEQLFAEVERMQRGADGDYNRLYELSKNYIYKIIHDIVRDPYTTEDLMQESYLQIYNKIGMLESPRAFYVWAGRIATNMSLRHIQKNRHEVLASADEEGSTDFRFEKADDDTEAFIPEVVLMDREKQRLIGEIIDSLSTEQKIAVQFFYFEEMSVKEIAAAMQCSEGTVKSRLNYARKSIKEAVLDLEVREGTKLYSLAALPLFFLVFRSVAEKLVIAGVTAAAAGGAAAAGAAGKAAFASGAATISGGVGVAGGGAASASAAGSVGSAVSAAGTAASASGAAAASGVAGTGAAFGTTAASSVAGTGAAFGTTAASGAGTAAGGSAGTSAGSGILAKIFGTTAGKVITGVTAAAVVTTGAVVTISHQKPKQPEMWEIVEFPPSEVALADEDADASYEYLFGWDDSWYDTIYLYGEDGDRTIRREEWKEPDFSYYVYEKDAWRTWDEDQREWGAVRDAIRSGKYGDIEVMLYDEANRYCVDFASYTDLRKKHTYMTWFVPEDSFDYRRQDPEYGEILIDPKGKLRVGDDWEYIGGGEYGGGAWYRDGYWLYDRRRDNDGWWYYSPFEPEYWGYERGPIEGTIIDPYGNYDARQEQVYAERGAGYYVTFDYESNHWIEGYYIGNRMYHGWTYDYDDGVNYWHLNTEEMIDAGVGLPIAAPPEPSEP